MKKLIFTLMLSQVLIGCGGGNNNAASNELFPEPRTISGNEFPLLNASGLWQVNQTIEVNQTIDSTALDIRSEIVDVIAVEFFDNSYIDFQTCGEEIVNVQTTDFETAFFESDECTSFSYSQLANSIYQVNYQCGEEYYESQFEKISDSSTFDHGSLSFTMNDVLYDLKNSCLGSAKIIEDDVTPIYEIVYISGEQTNGAVHGFYFFNDLAAFEIGDYLTNDTINIFYQFPIDSREFENQVQSFISDSRLSITGANSGQYTGTFDGTLRSGETLSGEFDFSGD